MSDIMNLMFYCRKVNNNRQVQGIIILTKRLMRSKNVRVVEKFYSGICAVLKLLLTFAPQTTRSDARVVEEARLESVYTPKAYRGFESPSLRKEIPQAESPAGFFVI